MWTIKFRFTRADYVALSVALARRSWPRRLVSVAIFIGCMVAAAGEELSVTISESGTASDTAAFRSEVDWPAVTQVIETSKHLFLAISRREAITLPDCAFESDDDCRAARDFTLAHVPEGTPHVTV